MFTIFNHQQTFERTNIANDATHYAKLGKNNY